MYSAPNMTRTIDRLAYILSELHNENAPLGWERYRNVAHALLLKLPIAEFVDDPRFTDHNWQAGRVIDG